MQLYTHEETGVSDFPTPIADAIRRAERFANKRTSGRRVNAADLIRFWGPRNPDALRRRNVVYEWLGGWGCSNSMPESTYTSLLGLAAWFDPGGALHYRVVADRVLCPRSPKGDVQLDAFGLDLVELCRVQPYVLVYPCLWQPRPAPADRSWLADVRRTLREDPTDEDLWGVLGDWHEDRGEETERLRCRVATRYAKYVKSKFE